MNNEFIDITYEKGPPVGSPVGGQNSWELGGVEMEFLRII